MITLTVVTVGTACRRVEPGRLKRPEHTSMLLSCQQRISMFNWNEQTGKSIRVAINDLSSDDQKCIQAKIEEVRKQNEKPHTNHS